MKKPELLAPAGSFEKAKVAFMYGADAVYAGTSSLSLRTRAEMEDSDLANTIKYAHSIGKKVYTAINIYFIYIYTYIHTNTHTHIYIQSSGALHTF